MKSVESVTCRVVRVYGSISHFGNEPRVAPPGSPVVLEDFPDKGDIATIEFGPIPDWYHDAQVEDQAANSWASISFIRKYISTREGEGPFAFSEENSVNSLSEKLTAFDSYIVIDISRPVRIPKKHRTGELGYPISWDFLSATSERLKELLIPSLDILSLEIGRQISRHFLQERIENCRVFVDLPDGSKKRVPMTMVSDVGYKVSGGDPPDVSSLFVALKGASFASLRNRFAMAYFWLTEATDESDLMKRFFWAFQSLEAMARSYCELSGARLQRDLDKAETEQRITAANSILKIDRLDLLACVREGPPFNPKQLAAAFSLLALDLAGSQFEDDLNTFKLFKDCRDGLAHGDNQKLADLPVRETLDFAWKYLDLIHSRIESESHT